MGTPREATDTITGYYYQFDYFILKILECKHDDDIVVIEGVEDIDLDTADEKTAIQCKYYAKTDYNHSVIAKPLRFMLDHYLSNEKSGMRYKIYGHYKNGAEKLKIPVTLTFFKENFLNLLVLKDICITDDQICRFLDILEIDNCARSLEDQENEIMKNIKKIFTCNDFESNHYYYNNALRVVRKLSTDQYLKNRRISKRKFIQEIDNKDILFNIWYLRKKDVREYGRFIKREFFSNLNNSPFERFFLIECDSVVSESEIKSLLIKISTQFHNISSRNLRPFCPYVYLHGISPEKLNAVLLGLQNDNFMFIDGYDFKGASFSVKSITKEANFHNGIKLKIIHEMSQIDLILKEIHATREIYQFFTTKILDLSVDNIHKHEKIPIEQTVHIDHII